MMMIQGKSLLAGNIGQDHGATFKAVDPTTNEALEPAFFKASLSEADQVMVAAHEAYRLYRTQPAEVRTRLLETIASEIESLGDELLDRCQAETGLPLARLQGERARTCGQLRLFAEVVREGSWVDARIDTALPDRQPLPRPDLRRMLIPLGPVVVFGASNFPLAFSVAGGDTASALAAGCPVVVKAHEAHPGTSELVGRAIQKAVELCDLPAGLFSLVYGDGPTVGVALVQHPLTAAVGFTGSQKAGRALHEAAATRTHPIPVFAEMSSVNPFFVLPEAMKARGAEIARGLLGSFTLGVGQFCTKPGLAFVIDDADTEVFLNQLKGAIQSASLATMLTPGICKAFGQSREQIMALFGVTLLSESSTVESSEGSAVSPSAGLTTADNFIKFPELATEAFGPFSLVVKCRNIAEMVRCAQSLEGQLTATLHGSETDVSDARALVSLLEEKAGRLIINGFPTGVEVSPAMNHGGPSPATTDPRFTSVGTAALLRFARPLCYQGFSERHLPVELQDANPRKIMRLVNGKLTRDSLEN